MITKSKYRLSANGRQYISAPRRDRNGRVSAKYFKRLILLFVIENGSYQPSIFKKYVETLNILSGTDFDYMTTRQYVEWKHNIDSAKDQLQNHGFLVNTADGSFTIPTEKFTEALSQVSDLIEVSASPVTAEIIEEQEYPAEKVSTVITRRIRDTVLSKSVKKQRNYECQVCGIKLPVGNASWYAEVHHLKPLGHDGPDTESNMLVLCPNHHVLFDYGAIAIRPENLREVIDENGKVIYTLKPPVPGKDFIQFHYTNIFQ